MECRRQCPPFWTAYFLGSSIGLTAIGESAPPVRELAGASAIMSGGMALGVMSLFNGAGRPPGKRLAN